MDTALATSSIGDSVKTLRIALARSGSEVHESGCNIVASSSA
jgi:hypothetical protein